MQRSSQEARLTAESTDKPAAPFVKWAGGKSSLLPTLLECVPSNFSDYYEPFLGGGALFFAVCARNTPFISHVSDVNAELVNAYRIIKDRPDELVETLSRLQDEYYRSKKPRDYYYEARDWRPLDSVESAARLIFLNKTCYNGLYRVNSRGEFNVPFGRYKTPRILNADNIRAISRALRQTKAVLSSADYKVALSACRKDDLVYLDPPYQPKSRTSSFTDYVPGGFSERDQAELAEEFRNLVERGCRVLLSNSDTPLTRELYQDFESRRITVNRPINSVGSRRTGYQDLIVIGNPV